RRATERPGRARKERQIPGGPSRAQDRSRPDAVIVTANGKSYSEILAMVTRRDDDKLSGLGSCVSKVRRTNNGNLLLEEAKESTTSAESMKDSIAQVLGGEAEVRSSSEESKVVFLEIRDLDALTKKADIAADLAKQYDFDEGKVKVRSIRPGYSEPQIAVISLPLTTIGWTICRIKERGGLPRTAQDLLTQTVREVGTEVAILSEPYRTGTSREWIVDRTGKAAIWLCGLEATRLSEVWAAKGFVPGAGSIIDLTYASSSLARQARWRISDIDTGSDHEAILVSIREGSAPRSTPPLARKAYRQD
ncbi:hypothetical protein KR084_004486, partial [Drosophila pseudotakahashii]